MNMQRIPRWIIITSIIYIIIFSFLSYSLRNSFNAGYDLGEEEHILWSTLDGKFFYNEIREVNHFELHSYFFTILILPIYYLFTNSNTLLILQSIFLVSGVIPLYLISSRNIKNKLIVAVISIAYFLYPTLWYVNLENFHLVVLGVPLLFMVLYFMDNSNWTYYFIFLFLFLSVAEYLSVIVIALGIYLFLTKRKRVGIKTFVFGLIWFIFIISIFMTYIGDGEYFIISQRYAHLGSSTFEIAETIITNPAVLFVNPPLQVKVNYVISLIKPLFLVPLLSPLTLTALPMILANSLNDGFQSCYLGHHNIIIIPIIFVSLIFGFKFITKFSRRTVISITILFILSATISSLTIGLIPILKGELPENIIFRNPSCSVEKQLRVTEYFQNRNDYNTIIEEFRNIPQERTVRVSDSIFSFFNKREGIKHLEFYQECVGEDFVIFNERDIADPIFSELANLKNRLEDIGYTEKFEMQDIHIFRRNPDNPHCLHLK